MEQVFIKILNMGISAGWLILAVIVLRFLLKRAPKWIPCLLWGIVAFRLICPFSIESSFSLIPSGEAIKAPSSYSGGYEIDSGVAVINKAFDQAVFPLTKPTGTVYENVSANAETKTGAEPEITAIFVLSIVWMIGMTGMIVYAAVSYFLLRRKVRTAVLTEGTVMICDEIDSPFIMGLFRPLIYMPSSLNDDDVIYVLAHERAHLRRRDHWWKAMGFVLLAVYWFHPLVWVAYILLGKDIELACDESVISEFDMTQKKAYASTLLTCSMHRKMVLSYPLAFGEVGVKDRVKAVLHYKKPAFWIVTGAVVVCAAVAVCFLTNPKQDGNSDVENHQNEDEYVAEKYRELEEELGKLSEEKNDLSVKMESITNSGKEKKVGEAAKNLLQRPVINLTDSTGTDLTELLYADGERIIFSGYFGLFVYSKETKSIIRGVDLEVIGCNFTQGDNYCEKWCSADGDTVYLHPLTGQQMYVYHVMEDTLERKPYDLEHIELHALPGYSEELDANYGDYDLWADGSQMMCTLLKNRCATIGELAYADFAYGVADEKSSLYYPLFPTDDSVGAMDFAPKDLTEEKSVSDWVSKIDLPPQYYFGNYQNYIGWKGGFLILPISYEAAGSQGSAPAEWQYSGLLSMIPKENTDITYTSGIPDLSGIPLQNHSEVEYIKVIGLERSTMQWPAIMVKESHDLYTAADLYDLKEKGVDVESEDFDPTSEYWTFYFVKESEDNYFVLSLSMKEFTQEEAERIAKSVIININ